MVAQAFQVGQPIEPGAGSPASLLRTMGAMFGVANLPLAVMLCAVAASSFRCRALPSWLGWISVLAAAAQIVLWAGTVIRTGPFAPAGWAGYVLYPAFATWLVPTSLLMMKRLRTAGGT
jgi:hypothetical protein